MLKTLFWFYDVLGAKLIIIINVHVMFNDFEKYIFLQAKMQMVVHKYI